MHLENSIITGIKIAWNQWFWYNWVVKKQYKPEAHAMNKSITQATQNDKQISKSIKRFFTRFHISSALKAVYGKGNPMITGHLGSSFYTFLTKCLISHGYRLFKCCFKCSGQCFQITLNFQTKKSMNWRMHLWMHFLLWWKYDCRLHKGWTLTTE